MTRRALPALALAAALLAAAAAIAQPAPAPAPASPPPGAAADKGPDSSDLFQAIHVVVGPSARALDPIALAPFRCPDGAAASCAEIDEVLAKDLTLSGFFNVLDRASFLGDPSGADPASPRFDDWFNVGAKYLVTTTLQKGANGLDLTFRLWSVTDRKAIPVKGAVAPGLAPKQVRKAVHTFVNGVIEALTGKPGIFGSQILLSLKQGWERTLVMMDMDGSGRRTVVDNGSANMFPRFAPGGILYTSFLPGVPQVYLGDKRITHDERQYRGAAVSPDGTRIAASVDMDGQSDLVLLDARTGEQVRRLTDSPWDEVTPSFSPDGRLIAYCSNKTGRPHIYVIGADGTGERRLTLAGSYNTAPRFGPKGVITFAGMDDFVSDIFTVDLGGNLARLTQQQGSNKDPAWSPDGRWLVFLSDRAGKWRVWIMTEDGRWQYPITDKAEAWGTPDWR